MAKGNEINNILSQGNAISKVMMGGVLYGRNSINGRFIR